jgi:hypothetical protein
MLHQKRDRTTWEGIYHLLLVMHLRIRNDEQL